MPILDDRNQQWPPPSWAENAKLITEARAWLTGDIAAAIGSTSAEKTSEGWRRRLANMLRRNNQTGGVTRGPDQHVPFARLVAQTSAALLFGGPPLWTVPGAHVGDVDGDGQPEAPTAEQQALIDAQDRLLALSEADGWISKLHQAAYVSSGLGGVVLRPVWGDTMMRPTLTVVHHDRIIPTFQWGRLVEAILWRDVEVEVSGKIWRHLEVHTPGKVQHSLWYGDSSRLGERKGLGDHISTKGLIGADNDGTIDLVPIIGPDALLVDYVPNQLPHPVTLSPDIGGSDTAGLEGRMVALDEAASGWSSDVRVGRSRLMIPEQFLIHGPEGAAFDADQELFTPIRTSALDTDQKIEVVQFDIRADSFAASKSDLMNELSLASGYNPESVLWANTGTQMTATEVLSRDAKSRDTTNSKRSYFAPAMAAMAHKMLQIEAAVYQSPITPVLPTIGWPEVDQVDDSAVAATINVLSVAGAISTEEKVRTRRPEWTDPEVAAEVARIRAEQGVTVEDPTGRF